MPVGLFDDIQDVEEKNPFEDIQDEESPLPDSEVYTDYQRPQTWESGNLTAVQPLPVRVQEKSEQPSITAPASTFDLPPASPFPKTSEEFQFQQAGRLKPLGLATVGASGRQMAEPLVPKELFDIGKDIYHYTPQSLLVRSVAKSLGPKAQSFEEGLESGVMDTLAGFTSPEMLVTLPVFAVPIIGQALALYMGGKATYEGTKAFIDAVKKGDYEQAGKAIPSIGVGALMLHGGATGAKGLLKPTAEMPVAEPVREIPQPDIELKPPMPTGEAPAPIAVGDRVQVTDPSGRIRQGNVTKAPNQLFGLTTVSLDDGTLMSKPASDLTRIPREPEAATITPIPFVAPPVHITPAQKEQEPSSTGEQRAGNVTGAKIDEGVGVPILDKFATNDFPYGATGFRPEEIAALEAAKSTGKITIFRAVVKGQPIRPGDFVTLLRSDAEHYLTSPGTEIVSREVPVSDVHYVGETGTWPIRYKFPGEIKTREPLTIEEQNAIQEQTAGKMGVRNAPEVRQKVVGQNEPEVTPEVRPTSETAIEPAQVPASEVTDRARYDALQKEIAALRDARDLENPRLKEAWSESEAIKNRYGGMPPPESQIPTLEQGKEAEINKSAESMTPDELESLAEYQLGKQGDKKSLKEDWREIQDEIDAGKSRTDALREWAIANEKSRLAMEQDFQLRKNEFQSSDRAKTALMSPSEWSEQVAPKLYEESVARFKRNGGKGKFADLERFKKNIGSTNHEMDIHSAMLMEEPVSAASVDAYGMKIPEGYIREGGKYVFQPKQPARQVGEEVTKPTPEPGDLKKTTSPVSYGEVPEFIAKKNYFHGTPFVLEGGEPSIKFGGKNYGRPNNAIFLTAEPKYAEFFSKKILINQRASPSPSVGKFELQPGNYKYYKTLVPLDKLDRVFEQIQIAKNEGYDGIVWGNGKEAAVFRDNLIKRIPQEVSEQKQPSVQEAKASESPVQVQEGGKAEVTKASDKSVRDHPISGTRKGDVITVSTRGGPKLSFSASEILGMTEWERKGLIEKETAHWDEEPGGFGQAARLRDSVRAVMRKLVEPKPSLQDRIEARKAEATQSTPTPETPKATAQGKVKGETIKQRFDKLALEYAIAHEVPFKDIVTENVKDLHPAAKSTHNAEVQRLRRVVFSELGIKGDTFSNADLEKAIPQIEEALRERARTESETNVPEGAKVEEAWNPETPKQIAPSLANVPRNVAQGDLLAAGKVEEPLALVGEKGIDFERVQREKEAAVQRAKEAKEAFEKQQQELPTVKQAIAPENLPDILSMKRQQMIDELHSRGITETFTGGYVKNLNVADLRSMLAQARKQRATPKPETTEGKEKEAKGGFKVSEDKTSVEFLDSKTGNTITASIGRVPGDKGTGSFLPTIDTTTPSHVGGEMAHGKFTQSFEQAQAELKQMLERKGFSGLQASKITNPKLSYGGSWVEGALEKQPGYDPEVAAEQKRFVEKIKNIGEQAVTQFQQQRQPQPFGQGPPEYGQYLSDTDIAKIPKLVKDYGDFWVILKWASSPRDRMLASDLARHYDKIVSGKEAANPHEYLREVFVSKNPFEGATKEPPLEPPQAPFGSMGPGAASRGEPRYTAAAQLTDRLKTAPPGSVREKLAWREKVADEWAKGKTALQNAFGKGRAITESLKETARGVRKPNDLERRIGELDFQLQKSSAQSARMAKTIKKTVPNQLLREATAIWIDAGGDTARIKDALDKLPDKTSPRIRRAVELASRLPKEGTDLADEIKIFNSIREGDAIDSDIFERGLEDYYTHIWKKEENMPDALRAAISNGKLSTYFQFARQRKIPTILDGILDGKTPVLDPAKVLPFYNYGLDRAIASREFIRDASNLEMPDGRPLLAATGTRQEITGKEYAVVNDETGRARRVFDSQSKADADLQEGEHVVEREKPMLLIRPQGKYAEIKDYRTIDHPALRKWKWADTDESGRNIIYEGDLLVHPEYYNRLANFMDRGRLTPSKFTRGALAFSGEVKAAKLGLLSLFHDVHVGSHAVWHWTNPFKRTGPIDWDSPATQFAVEKGHLKLAPDPAQLNAFAEELGGNSALVHKIPIIGPLSRVHSEWLFGEFIPKLKLQTFENAYNRSVWAQEHLGMFKGLTPEELAARAGDSVNNAYGELNHLFLGKSGRSPQVQRLLRGLFLAPDFGEARLRFAEKSLTLFGHEERLAMATMILTMYAAARIGNWLSHGDPETDWKNAFRVKVNDHWWGMRSVAGDLLHAMKDFGNFAYVRLNPAYSRTIGDMIYQRDPRTGLKLTTWDKLAKRPLEQLVPINATGLTQPDKQVWENFVTSLGLQAQREEPVQAIRRMFSEYKDKSKDPKIQAQVERARAEAIAPSDYRDLDLALRFKDYDKAVDAIEKLRLTHSDKAIFDRMNPFSAQGSNKPLFHESYVVEARFYNALPEKEKSVYARAIAERKEQWKAFQSVWKQRKARTPAGDIFEDITD